MIYLAVNGIEEELQNEVNKLNEYSTKNEVKSTQVVNSGETIVTVPPKKLKKNS
jgi:hypothetical protein